MVDEEQRYYTAGAKNEEVENDDKISNSFPKPEMQQEKKNIYRLFI